MTKLNKVLSLIILILIVVSCGNDKEANFTLKGKIKGLKKSTGRGSNGRITSWHKGGGHKKRYRQLNFNRTDDSTAIVTSLEYDPYRTANIASIYDIQNNKYEYILAPKDSNSCIMPYGINNMKIQIKI